MTGAGACSHCNRAKMRRGHVGACITRPTAPFEQTQIDWRGPSSVAAVPGGYRYLCVIVDVATGYMAVYPRRSHKAHDVVDCLTLYEGDMQHALSCVRTDGAPEMHYKTTSLVTRLVTRLVVL